MPRAPLARAGRWAPALLAALLLATRLADLDVRPYVLDEPQLQDAAVHDAAAHRWAQVSVLRGTQGLRYGPAPLWFYTAVHRVAGPRPESGLVAATLALTLCALVLAGALARASGDAAPWTAATALAVAAASPFAFFWARQGWDNPLLAGPCMLVAALMAWRGDGALRPARAAVVGLLLGLALDVHLMAVPFVAAATWVALGRTRAASGGPPGRGARLRSVAALAAGLALPVLPYARALAAEGASALPAPPASLAARLGAVVAAGVAPAGQVAGAGLAYFFDADWVRFLEATSLGAFPVVSGVLTVVVLLGAVGGLVLARRSGTPALARVARLALWTWALHAAFLGLRALPPEPHYQQPTVFVPVVGWALGIAAAWDRRPRLARGALVAACVLLSWGAVVQRRWMGWLREEGGTRGIHQGLTLAAQRSVLAAACATEAPGVALESHVVVFPQSLVSLARTEPACSEKRLAWCGSACPPLPPGWSLAVLRYAGPGARLGPVR